MAKNSTFLLIDDDEDDREIFAIALERIPMPVEYLSAANGPEGIKLLQDNPELAPDFIFIDLNMPYMGGIECLKKIKAMPHLTGTAVIMYTTSSRQTDVNQTKALGASHFLVKPASIQALSSLLSAIINGQLTHFFIE